MVPQGNDSMYYYNHNIIYYTMYLHKSLKAILKVIVTPFLNIVFLKEMVRDYMH